MCTTIETVEQLEQRVPIAPAERDAIAKILANHPMALGEYYMDLINWDDPNDPIRKMSIPSIDENSSEGTFDTSGEGKNTQLRGLQHKYQQTALILATNQCAMYCRYCFRKRLVGVDLGEVVQDWDAVVKYLGEHKEITNVLISGGDPLTLPTETIAMMLDRLSGIDHLRFIRIGTRTPVVTPARINEDDTLVQLLKKYSRDTRRIYLTTQFNHPREITPDSIAAIDRLNDAHITVNNQTVLLNGINDDPVVMAELQTRLVEVGVIPYYVFQCRPVKTVKHLFQVPLKRAIAVIEKTRTMLDGLAKRFRFVMSHETGKIEMLTLEDDLLYYKYHQTNDANLTGKLHQIKINETDGWLDL